MKVLITGGAGFIGSHIVDLLIENKYDVSIIDNLSHGKVDNLNPKATFYKVDIRDSEIESIFLHEKPEILIHHAAQISVEKSIIDPILDSHINIIGSINLFEAARKSGVKKIVYPSSAAIFGEPKKLPIDENHPLDMISGYGVSKHTVEHYLNVYKKIYGIEYIVFRYSNVYGLRQDSKGEGGVISIFADKFAKNSKPIIYGNGEQTRDFVYIKDVAVANLVAIRSSKAGIFNVCTNEETSINNLFKLFNQILDKDFIPEYQNEREGDIKKSYMSYEKINKELGWTPKYRLKDGLEEMIRTLMKENTL